MQSVIKLLPNQMDDRTASGDFIYVDSATGVFSLKVDSKWSYLLNQGDQIKMPSGVSFTSLEVSDLSGQPNSIKLRYGFGSLQPRVDHKKVDITTLPTMTLADGQTVNVGTMPALSIKAGQAVSVNNLPVVQDVSLNGEVINCVVGNLPAVQQVALEAGQEISVNNLPVVQKVTVEAGQEISVNNLPVVQKVTVEANQEISIKSAGSYNPLAPADFSVADVVVAAKATRQTLVIFADEINTGKIWVGGANVGIPLVAGQPFNLSTSAAITLHAEINTDKCYLAEINK